MGFEGKKSTFHDEPRSPRLRRERRSKAKGAQEIEVGILEMKKMNKSANDALGKDVYNGSQPMVSEPQADTAITSAEQKEIEVKVEPATTNNNFNATPTVVLQQQMATQDIRFNAARNAQTYNADAYLPANNAGIDIDSSVSTENVANAGWQNDPVPVSLNESQNEQVDSFQYGTLNTEQVLFLAKREWKRRQPHGEGERTEGDTTWYPSFLAVLRALDPDATVNSLGTAVRMRDPRGNVREYTKSEVDALLMGLYPEILSYSGAEENSSSQGENQSQGQDIPLEVTPAAPSTDSNVMTNENDIPDIDTTRIRNPYINHRRVEAAETELNSQISTPTELVRVQDAENRHEKTVDIAERFEAEFKISPKELASIEGIETLSSAQQKMLFENFTQLTLGSVREEAARLTTNITAERRAAAVANYGKVLGSAFAGIREAITRKKMTIDTERATAERARTGGFAEHRELLEQLVSGFVANGPQVVEKDGELIVDFVTLPDTVRGEQRNELARAAATLNEAANAFARLPAGERSTVGVDEVREKAGIGARLSRWLVTDKKEREGQERFVATQAQYDAAKQKFEQALREHGVSDIQITKQLLELDTRVTQQQMVMTDENAVAALGEIKDKQFWKEVGHSMVQGPGLYMFLGFAGRTSLSAAVGFLGAPLASAGIASLRSWNKSAALLRERDRNARAGISDRAEGALNVVTAESLISKTAQLIERANEARTEEEKQRVLNSLRARTEYIQDKMLLGRVSYGTRGEVVRQQTELAKTLAEATTLLVAEEQHFKSAMADRYVRLTGKLERTLDKHEQKILEEREELRLNDLTKSAYKASLFSIAGASLGVLSQAAAEATSTAPNTVAAAEVISDSIEPYVIERGDTLTKILKEQVLSNGQPASGQELDRFFKGLTPAELEQIGVRSGSADMIFAGETVDVNELRNIWEAKQGSVVDAFGEPARANEVTELGTDAVKSPEVFSETNDGADDDNDISETVDTHSEAAEQPIMVPEVAADMVTKIRAREISAYIPEYFKMLPNDWKDLRDVRVQDVITVVEKKESWFAILGTNTIPEIGIAVRNLGTLIQEAAMPDVAVKPTTGETVENFMRRLSTALAGNTNTETLPPHLRSIMEEFNKKTGTQNV